MPRIMAGKYNDFPYEMEGYVAIFVIQGFADGVALQKPQIAQTAIV